MNFENVTLMNSYMNRVSSNSPNSQNASYPGYPIGIHYDNTDGFSNKPNQLFCNNVSSIYSGSVISHTCFNSKYERNQFFAHSIGFKINNKATLMRQFHAGNQWFGTYPSTGGKGAAISDQLLLARTKFFVKGPIPSFGSPLWPIPSTPFMFQIDQQIDDNTDCSNPMPSSIEPPRRNTTAMDGTLSFSWYNTELLWQNQFKLYQEMLPFKDSFSLDSLEGIFLNGLAGTNMHKFAQIRVLEDVAKSRTESETNYEQSLRTQMTGYRDQLRALDSIPFDGDDTLAYNARYAMVASLIEPLHTIHDSFIRFNVIKDSVANIMYDSILIINAEIQTSHPSEMLLKIYNNLYFATYARSGMPTLTESQRNGYFYLASQCASINADVVFRSRAIAKLNGDTNYYHDDFICMGGGYIPPATDSSASDSVMIQGIISPNPSTGVVNLNFSEALNETADIYVYSMEGQILFEEHPILYTNTYSINLSNLNNGIYTIRVIYQNLEILNEKIVLQN
jgi:hypothetical protein